MATSPIPETGYLRLAQILGDQNADPPIPPLIPISRSSWFAGVKIGRFPKPLKIFGPRVAVYKVEDIRKLLEASSGFQRDNQAISGE